MPLSLTELEVKIVVAELPQKRGRPVMVTQIGDDLVFARMGVDAFISEVAGALDLAEAANPLYEVGRDFELTANSRAFRLALRRLSGREKTVSLDHTSLGSGAAAGELHWVDRSSVRFVAPCGEEHEFSRRDLETVAETFG